MICTASRPDVWYVSPGRPTMRCCCYINNPAAPCVVRFRSPYGGRLTNGLSSSPTVIYSHIFTSKSESSKLLSLSYLEPPPSHRNGSIIEFPLPLALGQG